MIEDSAGNKRFYGVYRGTVHSSKDPLNKRRVRLQVPQVLGDQPTEWAWGKDGSAHTVEPPTIGQGVWVMFEGGDPSFPVWVGTFGSHQAKGGQVNIKPFPKGTYPKTIKTKPSPNGGVELDLVATVIAIANKLEEVRLSLNAHGGGFAESPPEDVGP